jgi:DNA integrity scanning protein DisA with diadenylate cyclase activity|tara:strand:- start:138 stop:413 length:276 start_codon:yes stop_codon:yes gene_type:complete
MEFKDEIFKIVDDIVVSEINNESVILNLKTGIYFQVNELGSYIVSQLNHYSTLESLNNKITKDFDVEPNKSKKDLLSFIKDLKSKGLLHYK